MRRVLATALMLPIIAACSLTAPDLTRDLSLPVPDRAQDMALAEFMQERAARPLGECGLVSGRIIGLPGRDDAGIHVTLRNDVVSTSTTTNDGGEFQLRAPSPGPLLLVLQRTTADSLSLIELSSFSGHVLTIELVTPDAPGAAMRIGRLYTHSKSCVGPPPD